MASLIVGAGLLIHDKIKSDKAKRVEKKRKKYEARYNELEKEHNSHQADYLQRRATGASAELDPNKHHQSSTENAPARKTSQDSLGSQRDVASEDGPAKWVEEAMMDRQPNRQ